MAEFTELSFWQLFGIVLAALCVQRLGLLAAVHSFTRSSFAKKRVIYDIPLIKSQTKIEARQSLWTFVLDGLVISACLKLSLIQLSTQSSFATVGLAFFAQFLWFEFYFYAAHRAMHLKALYWIHRPHHVAQVAQTLTSESFSFAERAILVTGFLFPFVLMTQFIGPVPLIAFWLCFFVDDLFNAIGHSNIEIYPKGYSKSFFRFVVNCPSTHSMHHARHSGNYGLITPIFDKLFKTEFPDTLAVADSAKSGSPLTRLGAKIGRADAPTQRRLGEDEPVIEHQKAS